MEDLWSSGGSGNLLNLVSGGCCSLVVAGTRWWWLVVAGTRWASIWLANAKLLANRQPTEVMRESVASRLAAFEHRKSRGPAKHRKKEVLPRPIMLGGRRLMEIGTTWECVVCRCSSTNWAKMGPLKCGGSTVARWAAKVQNL